MNEALFYFLNNFVLRSKLFDALIIFGAEYLIWVLAAALIAILFYGLLAQRNKVAGNLALAFAAAVIAWGAAQIVKSFYVSPRPFLVLPDVNALFLHGDNDSFPSGHATFAFALATALYFYHRQLAYLYFVGAVLIGLSRIIAGIHWPVDILAGYALGGVIALVVYYLYRRFV